MITAKFGGTAITPHNLHYVREIVNDNYGYVVVSAIGKEHPTDVKVTDLLDAYYKTGNERLWQRVCDKYRRLVRLNNIDIDLQSLLDSFHGNVRNCGYGYCLSLGERLSAMCVAKYLDVSYTEAQEVVFFHKNTVNYRKTYDNLQQHYNGKMTVIGGFYGSDGRQVVTFPRGGSDITGSLCAVATDSTMYENWTDVNGVCIADPTSVANTFVLANLSYEQIYRLARCGAQVLHPLAVKPLADNGIPLRIANYFTPNLSGTLVSNCPTHLPIFFLAESLRNDKYITTVLFGDKATALAKVSAFCNHYNNVNYVNSIFNINISVNSSVDSDNISHTNDVDNLSADITANSQTDNVDNLPNDNNRNSYTAKIIKVTDTKIFLQSKVSILRRLCQFVD